MSEGVGWRLFACHVPWRCLGVSVGYLGVSGGYLGGVWRYLSGIHGNRRRLDVFGGILVPIPCSMEPKHYFGTSLKDMPFFHLTILRH